MEWLSKLLDEFPDNGNWSRRRRQIILARWPDSDLRAAEQDARNGKMDEIIRYDREVLEIKSAIPKE